MCDDHGMTLVNPLTLIWLKDSGASRHICANRSLFTTFKPLHNSMVTLPNHTSLPASFSGDVMINDCLILRDVLFVPGFKFNLIYVSALSLNSSLVVLFSDDGFPIQVINNKKMIGKGRRWNDLYLYQADASLVRTGMNKASVHVWHERLGHLCRNYSL